MAQHTPGPWSVNKYGSIGAGEHGTAPVVAHVEPFFAGPDTGANASLIAAAPDMLAALEAALVYLGDYTTDDSEEANETRRVVLASFHKAQGRT